MDYLEAESKSTIEHEDCEVFQSDAMPYVRATPLSTYAAASVGAALQVVAYAIALDDIYRRANV